MRRLITKFGLALCLGAGAMVSLSAPVDAQAAIPKVKKMAMVDLQRVLNETKAGKAARKKLEGAGKTQAAKFEKKRAKLEKDFSKLQTLKGAELAAAQEQLQKDQLELQNLYATMQQGLMEDEAKMTEKFYKNASAIVKEISKEQGLDLVLVRDPMTVIWAKAGLDITEEVITRYDKKHPS